MRVLDVEDYRPVRSALTDGLREQGFAVDAAADGAEGLWYAESNDYDAIVLDLMLPKLDGLEVLTRLRRAGSAAPVLILTARDTLADRVDGLNLGADDYLVKPFEFAELLARVRALVRRRYASKDPVLHIADLEVDTVARKVRRAGESVELSAREYALLELLVLRAGAVVSRTEIWEHIYDFGSEAQSNVVDVYIGYLRKKLERPHLVKLIHTRRGEGYVLGEQP